MKTSKLSRWLFVDVWNGWRLWLARSVCIGLILLLGTFRFATEAEFSLASLAMLPVIVLAWGRGLREGLLFAFFAAGMWTIGDIYAEGKFSLPWIPWVNGMTRWMTYSLSAYLVAQVRLQFEREHEHATRDALTKLHNRRAFFEAGASEVERSKRHAHSLAIAFLDLDNFKQLNDTQGHDVGDLALKVTARSLNRSLRPCDIVARLGGDEFAILLPEIGHDEAVELSQKISEAVNQSLEKFSPVQVSVGVAWFETADRQFPAMLKVADELMYEVKESGKANMHVRRFDAHERQEGDS
ncbi:diguanylate cyclase (GGDEF) domain-containing protein [Formivibrio citricus]|uniref:Diguanylate cyclase (GGDEF) domain-containing protein n=1 Tax=Formivibrio citricus TaxID=83765 RepID=A0A1I4YXS6_9NEIS|nr:GGDEF domain-containing protein [Formivibrio citricus]SFN42824.1 diguanylate cyclase (GGDEF) domain-containing protein [Formivibrio citricus]